VGQFGRGRCQEWPVARRPLVFEGKRRDVLEDGLRLLGRNGFRFRSDGFFRGYRSPTTTGSLGRKLVKGRARKPHPHRRLGEDPGAPLPVRREQLVQFLVRELAGSARREPRDAIVLRQGGSRSVLPLPNRMTDSPGRGGHDRSRSGLLGGCPAVAPQRDRDQPAALTRGVTSREGKTGRFDAEASMLAAEPREPASRSGKAGIGRDPPFRAAMEKSQVQPPRRARVLVDLGSRRCCGNRRGSRGGSHGSQSAAPRVEAPGAGEKSEPREIEGDREVGPDRNRPVEKEREADQYQGDRRAEDGDYSRGGSRERGSSMTAVNDGRADNPGRQGSRERMPEKGGLNLSSHRKRIPGRSGALRVGESANIPRSPERRERSAQATPPVSLTEATFRTGSLLLLLALLWHLCVSARPATERDIR